MESRSNWREGSRAAARPFGIRPLSTLVCLLLVSAIAPAAWAGVVNGVDVPGAPDSSPARGPAAVQPLAAVLINFDDVTAPCVFVETGPLRDAYAALGVHFLGPDALSGGAILNACSNFSVGGYSGANFLAFNSATAYPSRGTPSTPETITFDGGASTVSLFVGAGSDPGPVELDAYDAANHLVASSTLSMTPLLRELAVSGPGIVRVVLRGGSVFVADNLVFTPGSTVAAQPASWGQVKAIYR